MNFMLRHIFINPQPATVAVSVLMFVFAPNPAAAQADSQRAASAQKNVTLLGIPSATVAPSGLSFASVYSSFDIDGGNQSALSLGHGFGDANQQLGFQISATAATGGGGAGSEDLGLHDGVLTGGFGYLGLKVSHRLTSGAAPTYVGLSVDRLGGWGDAEGFDPAYSVVVTRFSHMQFGSTGENYPVMFTVGGGTGASDLGYNDGVYLGAGIGLTETYGASAAWNGDNITLGAAIRPRSMDNVSIAIALEDAFDEDDRQRLSFSVSWFGRDLFRR